MQTDVAKALFAIFCAAAIVWAAVTVGMIVVMGRALYEGDLD